MNRIFTAAIALAACALASAAAAPTANDYQQKFADFDHLVVLDDLHVVYRYTSSPDSAGLVTYRCTPKLHNELIFESRKSTLRIQHADDGRLVPEGTPTITVYSTSINKLTNNGDSTLVAEVLPPTPSIKIRVIGNGEIIAKNIHATKVDAGIVTGRGHIVVTGRANSAFYSNLGTGTIEGGSLLAANVRCRLVGTGAVDCSVSEQLAVEGMGSGTVYYMGSPSKISNRSIGIDVVEIKPE